MNDRKDKTYKKDAKDFRYPKETIQRIKDAKSDNEIYRIMRNAREERFGG